MVLLQEFGVLVILVDFGDVSFVCNVDFVIGMSQYSGMLCRLYGCDGFIVEVDCDIGIGEVYCVMGICFVVVLFDDVCWFYYV